MAMSKSTDTTTERDDIEMLLPWYVTGKLDAADRTRVEAYLTSTPDLARQVDLIRAEQTEARRVNEALRAPASLTVERLLAAVPGPHKAGAMSRVATMIRAFFTMPSAGMVRLAATAAGVVMLLQAATVGYLLSERPSAGYQQASGGPSATLPGRFALVRFADAATAKEIATTLADLEMSVVEGPRQGALFRVRLGEADLSDDARDARIDALRRRTNVVSLVTPSP